MRARSGPDIEPSHLVFCKFTRDAFCFDANMCCNHVTAIPAVNHLQQRNFKNRATYDAFYDEVLPFSRVGHDKCDATMIEWIRNVLQGLTAAEYYDKTWSLASGHGRFPVVYGGYGGSTTNGGAEAQSKDKRLMCLKSAKLGTFISSLISNAGSRSTRKG
jgi:hypothetical protein